MGAILTEGNSVVAIGWAIMHWIYSTSDFLKPIVRFLNDTVVFKYYFLS